MSNYRAELLRDANICASEEFRYSVNPRLSALLFYFFASSVRAGEAAGIGDSSRQAGGN